MSDDVAVVRALFESTKQRDIEGITRLLDPDLVWEAPPSHPGGSSATYRGVEGYFQLMDDVGSEGGVWMRLLDVRPLGEQNVLATVAIGTDKRGGIRASLRFRIVNGRVLHARTVFPPDDPASNSVSDDPGADG